MERAGAVVRRRIPWGQVTLLAVTALASGLAFQCVFESRLLVVPVVVAVALPILVGVTTRARGAPHLAWSIFAHGVAFAAGWLLAAPAGGRDLATLRSGLADGWAGILAASVPVPSQSYLFVVPYTIVFVATAASFEVIGRTRRCVVPALPPLAAAGVAFALGADGPRSSVVVTLGLVLGSAALVLVRSRAYATEAKPFDRRVAATLVVDAPCAPTPWKSAAVALPSAGLVALLLASVLPPFASGRARELHDDRTIPERQVVELNPLARTDPGSGADDARGAVLFRVAIDPPIRGCVDPGGRACPRFPVAVLDHFDGALWTARPRYVTAGAGLPARATGASATASVTQRVVVERLPDPPVLPALDRPEKITGLDDRLIQFDRASGVIRLSDRAPSAHDDLRYTVWSARPVLDPASLPGATVATDPDARAAVQQLPLPPNLAAVKDRIVERAASPFQQLAGLSAFFTDKGSGFTVGDDPDVPGGFTLQRLERLVSDPKAVGAPPFARVGSREQFAAAFTVIAKAMGFPARLTVGYSARTSRDGQQVVVRASDLTAWPEVALDGFGWVRFDPDPSSHRASEQEKLGDDPFQEEVDRSADLAESNDPTMRRRGANPNLVTPDPSSGTPGWVWAVATGIAVLLLLLVPSVTKGLRRGRRRHRGDPGQRIAAAWNDALDPLRESGVKATSGLTVRAAADEAAERFGAPAAVSLAALGALVDRALHDQRPPADVDAEEAWRKADRFRSGVRGALPIHHRLKAQLDPRPLLARDKTQPSTGPTRWRRRPLGRRATNRER